MKKLICLFVCLLGIIALQAQQFASFDIVPEADFLIFGNSTKMDKSVFGQKVDALQLNKMFEQPKAQELAKKLGIPEKFLDKAVASFAFNDTDFLAGDFDTCSFLVSATLTFQLKRDVALGLISMALNHVKAKSSDYKLTKEEFKGTELIMLEVTREDENFPTFLRRIAFAFLDGGKALLIGPERDVQAALDRKAAGQTIAADPFFNTFAANDAAFIVRMKDQYKDTLAMAGEEIAPLLQRAKGLAWTLNCKDNCEISMLLVLGSIDDANLFKTTCWDTQAVPIVGMITSMVKEQYPGKFDFLDKINAKVDNEIFSVTLAFSDADAKNMAEVLKARIEVKDEDDVIEDAPAAPAPAAPAPAPAAPAPAAPAPAAPVAPAAN